MAILPLVIKSCHGPLDDMQTAFVNCSRPVS
jgi:hypothetical protein